MNRESVWIVLSYSWSEIGLDRHEYYDYAKKIAAKQNDLPRLKKIAFWDVAGAFATFTVSALVCWPILPDWGFEDDYVVNKVTNWLKRPLLFSFMNPVWLVGYPLACLIVFSGWYRLRKSTVRALNGRNRDHTI